MGAELSKGTPLLVTQAIRPITPMRRLVLLVLCVGLALAGAIAWQLHSTFRYQQAQTEQAALNLSGTLLAHTEQTVLHADSLLHEIAERFTRDGGTPAALTQLQQFVRAQAARYPGIHQILIIDRHARPTADTRDSSQRGPLINRDYFQHHLHDGSTAPYIGAAFRSRLDQQWVVTVSRRLNDGQGAFAGVAVVGLSVSGLLDRLRTLSPGGQPVVDLLRDDGTALLQAPVPLPAAADQALHEAVSRQVEAGHARQGILTLRTGNDAAEQVVGFASSATLPLYLAVGLDTREAFAPWRQEAISLTLAGLLTLMVLAILVGKSLLGERAMRRAEARLQETWRHLLETRRTLETLATSDCLTGLANRRRFDEALTEQFTRARQTHAPIALILIDIDDFRAYNHTFGHQAGDRCLRQISACLRDHLPTAGALAARYGGEELALLLPHSDERQAQQVAEQVRQAIHATGLPHPDSLHGRVTLSLGVAACVPSAEAPSPLALVRAADSALYHAKRSGKNCTCGSQPEASPACA